MLPMPWQSQSATYIRQPHWLGMLPLLTNPACRYCISLPQWSLKKNVMVTGRKTLRQFGLIAFFLAGLLVSAQAQNPLEPGHKNAPVAEVTFELNWRQANPQYYSISVESTGDASYQSQPQTKEGDTPGDPYMLKFIASEPTRTKIFDLAEALGYFKGKFETKYKVAQTGTKTLTYRDGQKEFKTQLNYSDNPQMRELIDIFQKMSTTFEMSRKLDYDIRFDKLGLDRDLKSMEEISKGNGLIELQVISPTLQRIASDNSVINISRQRARRLLDSAQMASGGR